MHADELIDANVDAGVACHFKFGFIKSGFAHHFGVVAGTVAFGGDADEVAVHLFVVVFVVPQHG